MLAGYAYTWGGASADPSLPLDDAELDIHSGFVAAARSIDVFGKSAKIDAVLPYAWLDGSADFEGESVEREVDGFADPRFRFSVNLYGAPAMSLEQWRSYRQDLIIGTSLQISVPMGQYDRERLVNLGSNRWAFKPEIGISKAAGAFIFELSAASALFTDNNDYVGRTRRQDAIFSTQGHLLYTFWRNMWASFDVTYYGGGQSKVDGDRKDDRLSSARVGLTLAIPVSPHYSLKLYGSTAVATRTGTDFSVTGIALQYRWGGGL